MTATGFFRRRLGKAFRFYRLAFNLIAVATLVPVAVYSFSIDGPVLFGWRGGWWVLPGLLGALVAVLSVGGARHYDLAEFLGVRQIASGVSHRTLTAGGCLHTGGILGVVRHPWYLAAMILLWVGYGRLTVARLLVNVVLTLYLIVGTRLEERKLLAEFGDEYRRYQQRVSMLVPLKWLARPG